MKIAVLIVAAGRGSRAGGEMPKQYRNIGTEPVIAKTINCFVGMPEISHIKVAIHPDDLDLFEKATVNINSQLTTIAGGKTRTESVLAGLLALEADNPDLVLIHDAARPFVSQQIIKDVIEALEEYQASVPALTIPDALKTLDGDAFDRDTIVRVQTPQGFRFNEILTAYKNLPANVSFADDIEVARNAGMSIGMCTGSDENIKLTFPRDFEKAERNMAMISVTGSGYDVHRIGSGESVWLCGVEIDSGFSLQGHSDADVGLHALTDALLGAISEGDIGDHFPPSDPQWKGAPSRKFLKFAAKKVTSHGAIIDHVDLTLICEAPKIKPHREQMRQTIADILDIPIKAVSVKATTTEGLGFAGRREGIAAQAIANIRVPHGN